MFECFFRFSDSDDEPQQLSDDDSLQQDNEEKNTEKGSFLLQK